MASPVAHTLAGAVIYLVARRNERFRPGEFLIVVLAANLADLDLIPGILMGDDKLFHRHASHSLAATAALVALFYGWLRYVRHPRTLSLTAMGGVALLSQLGIDWLSYDPTTPQGIPLLWPFQDQYFMSDTSVFMNIRRDSVFTAEVIIHNLKAVLREAAIMGGPVLVLIWARIRRQSTADA